MYIGCLTCLYMQMFIKFKDAIYFSEIYVNPTNNYKIIYSTK